MCRDAAQLGCPRGAVGGGLQLEDTLEQSVPLLQHLGLWGQQKAQEDGVGGGGRLPFSVSEDGQD